jgi:PAS domain S-box-containing protein
MLDSEGRVVSWNAGAQRLLGYAEADAVGRHLPEICPLPGTLAGDADPRVAAIAAARYEDQGWVTRGDGTRFWGAIVLTPVQDEGGRARRFAVSIRDVSERRSLERDIIEISEREQQRIGHDLHDGLGQELSGISLMSAAMSDQAASGLPVSEKDAEQVAELICEAIAHVRDLARGLCPTDLEDEGLPAALERLSSWVSRLPGVRCSCDIAKDAHIDSVTASHLYRIAQEAINNATRHGGAKRLNVLLKSEAGRVRLTVVDNGIGFKPELITPGMGLRLMNYRAKIIRGTLDIRSAEAGGTIVECTVDAGQVE